jgi:hypothetical protein
MSDLKADSIQKPGSDISSSTLLAGLLLAITCLYANVARNSYVGDFRAYYLASAALLDHLDPYLNHAFLGTRYVDPLMLHYVHSRFIYPPSSLIFFKPLARLSFTAAKVLFCTSMATLMAGVMVLLHRRHPRHAVVLIALFISMPMFMNMENGQIDILILALIVAAFYLKDGPLGGFLLGLAIAIKVWPVLALLWFLVNRRWRTALFSLATSGALAVFATLHWGLGYWREFFANVRSATDGGPLSSLPVPVAVQQAVDSNTLDTLRDTVAHRAVFSIVQNPLRFLGHAQAIVGLAIVVAFFLWLECSPQGRRTAADQRFFAFVAATLLTNQALWATGLVALFPLTILLVQSSVRPNRAALLLVAPLLLPRQVLGEWNFLVWILCAAFCMYENGWFSGKSTETPMASAMAS